MKKVNVQLSAEAHTKAKIIAVLNGKTMSEYFSEAIEKQLKKDENQLKKLRGGL